MSKLGSLAAGSVLGRYELVLRVASGGMGEIWAARIKGSRGFQKVVALKTLLPELSANPKFEQMFLDEAALAARIKHPNVVQVIDLGEESEVLFQVMEWVSGESLWGVMRAAAKRGGIPLPVAARIVYQVCAGLHAAHEVRDEAGKSIGLVHRDVSPQNILLTAQGLAKVVDFGVAKFAGRGAAATQVGELRGKVPYMAPEHIQGQVIDRKADVFALGLLFYQLVSGVHPFLSDNDQLTMARISSATPAVPLRKRASSVSEELSRVVAAAIEKSPAKRTATALELMQQIERAVPDAGQQSSNDRVAAFLKQVVGPLIEERDQELREALKKLDGQSSLPSSGKDEAPISVRSPGVPHRAEPAAAPGGAADRGPAGSRFETPHPVVTPTGDVSAELSSAGMMAPAGLRATWIGRNPLVAGAALVAVIAGTVVGLASRRSTSDVTTESRTLAAPPIVAAALRAAIATEPPADEPHAQAPSAPAAASAEVHAGAQTSTAPTAPTAPTPHPSSTAPPGSGQVKPIKPTQPREYTPGGI